MLFVFITKGSRRWQKRANKVKGVQALIRGYSRTQPPISKGHAFLPQCFSPFSVFQANCQFQYSSPLSVFQADFQYQNSSTLSVFHSRRSRKSVTAGGPSKNCPVTFSPAVLLSLPQSNTTTRAWSPSFQRRLWALPCMTPQARVLTSRGLPRPWTSASTLLGPR